MHAKIGIGSPIKKQKYVELIQKDMNKDLFYIFKSS